MIINMKYTYKLTPKYLEVKESPIHGVGVFAKDNIKKDFVLPIYHFYYNDELIRKDIGGIFNHSESPNLTIRFCMDDGTLCAKSKSNGFRFQATRDIKVGEELTCNYADTPCVCGDDFNNEIIFDNE